MLDLVLAGDNVEVSVVRSDSSFVCEDIYHPALHIVFSRESPKRQVDFPLRENTRYNFLRADFSSLCSSIGSFDWSIMETFKSVNDALDYFYVRLFEIINDIVPKITHSSGRRRFPVWFTKDLKRNIQTKNYYRTKWRTEGNRKYLNAFRRLRTLVKAQISSEYDGYLAEVQNQIKSDPFACWRYLD